MATTVGNFSAIDDTEVDAESPVTETLVTRLRDNSYWINAGTNKTTQATAGVWLEADGSGGVRWTTPTTIDGTKGTESTTTLTSSSWVTLTTSTSGLLSLHYSSSGSDSGASGRVIIDLSDDTFVGDVATDDDNGGLGAAVSSLAYSGTITTGQQVGLVVVSGGGTAGALVALNFRRDSGNLQYQANSGNNCTLNASWVII